ncbi:hypothetical protein C2S53_012810 [Perilla frutescens var. hirtella]|uniref:F-box domain-containing protein n=1 Tax=Perilla frutescens var. hirtella TaxID=608512 RepID=A0AAD4JDS4_PERFH|nr:hypothetical protein C2S53_012810 [Perilla frutescens var. hirtella]
MPTLQNSPRKKIKMKPKITTIPSSALRQPPPPRRSVDGSDLNMLSKGGNSNIRMFGDLNSRTRPYYSRRCKRVSSTNIQSLPDELLFHILVRLQADYLCDRARLVCRRWYHIIHSHAFVSTHLQHSTYGLLLSSIYGGDHPIFVTVTEGRIQTFEFSYKCRKYLMGSCNGLAMGINHNGWAFVHIINPATKQPFVLPSFSGQIVYNMPAGIAYAATSMEYKVAVSYMAHMPPDSPSVALGLAILTAGVDNSWRYVRVEHLSMPATSLVLEIPFITEGFMHWATEEKTTVLTLDVETEILTVSEVPLPKSYCMKTRKYYLSTGRSLSLLVACENFLWELWEMKPETREWMKLVADIKLGAQKCRLQQFAGGDNDVLEAVGWVKYPEVLALHFMGKRCSRTCIFYNLDTHEINSTELSLPCEAFHAVVHKNSLMWLS